MFKMDASACLRDMQKIADEIPVIARQALGQGASLAVELARSTGTFKDKTGRLRSSIAREDLGGWKIRVVARAPYALYVEEDTRPHEIHAKSASGSVGPLRPGQSRSRSKTGGPLLRFVIGGRVIFAKSVHHPGTTGKHFMQKARDSAEQFIDRTVDSAISSVVRR